MSAANPYMTPEAVVGVTSDERYQPKIFAASGRIGRLRYLAYSTGLNLVVMLIVAALAAALGTSAVADSDGATTGLAFGGISILLYLALIVLAVIFGKRRINDLNKSGWLLLLFLVPLVNIIFAFYLIFFKGTEGENDFGPAPVPNTIGVTVLGLVLPLIFLVGTLSAILIPAYQVYQENAQYDMSDR